MEISGDFFDERRKIIPGQDGGRAGKEVGRDCLAGFDFHGVECIWSSFDEGVDFVALLVTEEMEGGQIREIFSGAAMPRRARCCCAAVRSRDSLMIRAVGRLCCDSGWPYGRKFI